ncbi:MAG: hypothetical protein KDA90_00025 [Planctomycetaceae bacterium]|nr:hypothetical protein [Planctomycetaceae bacterium]
MRAISHGHISDLQWNRQRFVTRRSMIRREQLIDQKHNAARGISGQLPTIEQASGSLWLHRTVDYTGSRQVEFMPIDVRL